MFTNKSPDHVDVEESAPQALDSAPLARVMPELKALQPEELQQINVDIPYAVALVLGCLPELRGLREDIARAMSSFDLAVFDRLEDYTLALNDAHGAYLAATQPADDLDELVIEASRLRALLLTEATALGARGVIDRKKLAEVRGPVGYKNVAVDLSLLYRVLMGSWSRIQGKTTVAQSELERAAKVAQQLIRALVLREQGMANITAAGELRQRAFTVFIRAYDHVRRAVSFLRWNLGDADDLAPSLYWTRSASGKRPWNAQSH